MDNDGHEAADYYINLILELEMREDYLISVLDRLSQFTKDLIDGEVPDSAYVSGLYLIKETEQAVADYNEHIEEMRRQTILTCMKYDC